MPEEKIGNIIAELEKALDGFCYGSPCNSNGRHKAELTETRTGSITEEQLSNLKKLGFVVIRDSIYDCLYTAKKTVKGIEIRIGLWDREKHEKMFQQSYL